MGYLEMVQRVIEGDMFHVKSYALYDMHSILNGSTSKC